MSNLEQFYTLEMNCRICSRALRLKKGPTAKSSTEEKILPEARKQNTFLAKCIFRFCFFASLLSADFFDTDTIQ